MADIQYNEEKHEYTLNGEIVPSVTQLAQKFSGYDTTWLQAHPEFAERGTEIHNELAEFYTPGSETTRDKLSSQAYAMSIYLPKAKEDTFQTEVLVYNEKLKYAGTVDLLNMVDGKCFMIVDWKTGTHNNKLYCRCQLSLYYLALKEMGVDVSETGMCIITPDGPYYFEPFTWAEMQNLLADFAPEDKVAKRISELETQMAELEYYVQKYEDNKQELKELLSKGFEDTKTRKYNGEFFMFTYVPKSTRKSFDSSMARQIINDDEAYESCFKETSVAATVRIKEI